MNKDKDLSRDGDELCPAEKEEEEVRPEEDSEEIRNPMAPRIPVAPSREEVQQHRLTHRPFRSWCPHCVRGKGRASQHRQSTQKHEVPGIPKLASDYFFVGSRRPTNRGEREAEERTRVEAEAMAKEEEEKALKEAEANAKAMEKKTVVKVSKRWIVAGIVFSFIMYLIFVMLEMN